MFKRKQKKIEYDTTNKKAVLKCSICNGEQVAGFKDMKITMLGTGHAVVTKYYNTCFTIDDRNEHFLVDGGGGSEILQSS